MLLSMFHPQFQKLFAFTFSFNHSFVCEVFLLALLSQHESMWVTQRSSGAEANFGYAVPWELSPGAAVVSVHIPASRPLAASLWRRFISWKSVGAKWDMKHSCLNLEKVSFIKITAVHLCLLCFSKCGFSSTPTREFNRQAVLLQLLTKGKHTYNKNIK